jgi:hypothetical protein
MKWNMIMITQKKRKANYFYGYLPLNQKYSPVKNVLSIIMIHCIIFIIIINLSQNLDSYILNGCLKYYVLTTGCYMSPQFFLLYHIQVHVWCLLYKKNSSRPTLVASHQLKKVKYMWDRHKQVDLVASHQLKKRLNMWDGHKHVDLVASHQLKNSTWVLLMN